MEYDYTFYHDDDADTRRFIDGAIEAFANQMIGLPDIVYLEFWRRLTLPSENWTSVQHGPVTIQIRTPQDNGVPLPFENLNLRKDTIICARKRAIIPATMDPPVPVINLSLPQ